MSNLDNICCELCEKDVDENLLLLCDNCDKGFHTYCINLVDVPNTNWYCAKCRFNNNSNNNSNNIENYTPKSGDIVICYLRVSSKGQDNPQYGRVGLATQNNVILDFALKNGLIIRQTRSEICSASKDMNKLTQLHSIISCIRKNECLLIYSVSRFGRDFNAGKELIDKIHKKGAWVYSITDKISSYNTRFIDLLKEAQHESEKISVNQIASIQRIKQNGGHIGPPPFGTCIYRDSNGVRKLKINNEEGEIIKKIRALYKKEGNYEIVVNLLNFKGILKRGNLWSVYSLKNVLKGINGKKFARELNNALE